MKFFNRWVFCALLTGCWAGKASAAFIGRPELSDYNFAGAGICEKNPLKVKFDFGDFGPGNVFTVEIADAGNFTGSNIIPLTGTLSLSGSMQNVFFTVNFPLDVPAGTNYRLRIKGSNPAITSTELNVFPFAVQKFIPSDPNFIPQNYWRGYFYTWTPSISTPIPNGNNEDIFNPARYCGYISDTGKSFDFNWGNNIVAPASYPDTNRVCGSYQDFFSIRMRRRFVLEAGYYVFSGGADDGFRFSIDNGQTWLLNDWSDHQFREVNNTLPNSCGKFLSAGTYDFLVEYYENKIDARFKFSMIRTSQSADFTGLQASYCQNAPPVTLISSLQGVFIGPGVNGNVFSPQLAGAGTHIISHYLTGPCSDTVRKTVVVTQLPDAGFSGLAGQICADASAITLQPNTAGGNFSGSGISGNVFSPAGLPTGISITISYSVGSSGCQNQSSQSVIIQPVPNAGFSGLPNSVCLNSTALQLQPLTPSGTFTGPGISGNFFSPTSLKADTSYTITYSVTLNGCSSQNSQQVQILASADAGFSGLPDVICADAGPITLQPNTPGGVFEGSGVSGNVFSPAGLPTGVPFIITHKLNSGSICSSEKQKAIVIQAAPDPTFSGLPDSLSDKSGRISLNPTSAGGVFSGQGVEGPYFYPDRVSAPGLFDVSHTIATNGCSAVSVRKVFVYRFFIPNLITINGDTRNDDWLIKGLPADSEIKIFNRWGLEVFSGIGSDGWNPVEKVSEGLYFYQIQLTGESNKLRGWIEITARKE